MLAHIETLCASQTYTSNQHAGHTRVHELDGKQNTHVTSRKLMKVTLSDRTHIELMYLPSESG